MNLFRPSEASDILACITAACGAPVLVCGSCCDCDCCGARGCSWARSGKAVASSTAVNTRVARGVVIRLDVEVCYPTNCRTNGCRASAPLARAGEAPALQFDPPQTERVRNY